MDKEMDQETVKFSYSSSRNISFHGWVDSGYTWDDWNEMTEDEQNEITAQALWELVDIDVIDAGADPDRASDPWSRR